MKVNDRFIWAVEMLHINPDDHILEIGCGHGIAVSLIAPRLKTGSITAIDSSRAMIDKAQRKNEGVEADFIHQSFCETALDQRFDKIFAFNVNIFLNDACRELTLIRNYLAPLGALYVFHQPPPSDSMEMAKGFADRITTQLESGGYVIRDVLFKKLTPAPCVCIISQPSPAP